MTHPWRAAVCTVPCAGQVDNGDAAWLSQTGQVWRALLVDASGHGARR